MPNPNTEPSALEQNYPTTQPNRSYNDFTQLEQQIANSEDGTNYAELRARIEALEAALGIVRPDLEQAQEDIDSLEDGKVDKETGKELMPSNLPLQVNNNSQSIENITNAMGNKVDKVTGYSLLPIDFNQRVPQLESDVIDLRNIKQDQMQFTELPNAQDYIGKIVQYVGPTTPLLNNGYFYQAVFDGEQMIYTWVEKSGSSNEYTPGQGIEIVDNEIKCTLLNDTLTSTTTTWSSQKLRAEFEAISGATKVYIVAELPAIGEINAIYYQGTEAPYNIYLYSSSNEWVLIGTTGVNLQNYYTKTEVDNKLTIIENNIKDNKPNPGYGIEISQLPNHLGKNIAAKGTAPIDVVVSDGIILKYNKGLDINTDGELEVNIGDGLKIRSNKIITNIDGDSIRLNPDNEMYVPLKNVAGENIIGTGNISFKTINNEVIKGTGNISTPAYDDFFAKVGDEIMYSGPIIGYLAYNSARYMTCLTFFKSLKNITNLRIKKLDVGLRDNGGYLKYHAVIGDAGTNTGASFPIIDNYTEQKTGITADGYKTGSENQWWLNINLDQASRITTTLTGNPPVTNTPLMFMFANCVFECI